MIFSAFWFPYIMAGIPFAVFFESRRTSWLEEKGLEGTDFNKITQFIIAIIMFIVFLLVLGGAIWFLYFMQNAKKV